MKEYNYKFSSFFSSLLESWGVVFLFVFALPCGAQETAFSKLYVPEQKDSIAVGKLAIDVDALTFFRDNEYDSDITKGYTLPGAWVRPSVQYNPLGNIHLELGVSALFFSGANKYPCYSFHDIPMWKGEQYQKGCHLLPWVRADFKAGHFNFVLGNIYGGANHDFSTPLYNKEQMLLADPEMGFQILFKDRHFRGDAYIDWQSFQFRNDNHQEVFTVGVSTKTTPFDRPTLRDFSVKASLLIQHRGGEMDVPSRPVQTNHNALLGILWEKDFKAGFFNSLAAEADVLGCFQQTGHLWHFDSGAAYNASVTANYLNGLHTQLGFFAAPSNFISLYGNPYFSTVSTKNEGEYYSGTKNAYLDFGYARTFAKAYTIGASLEMFSVRTGNTNIIPTSSPNTGDVTLSTLPGKSEFNFAFGVYMRINPSFILGK